MTAEPDRNLAAIRADIDATDAQLVALLAQRADLVAEAWRWKAAQKLPVCDRDREAAMARRMTELSRHHGLDPSKIAAIFRAVVGEDLRRPAVADGEPFDG